MEQFSKKEYLSLKMPTEDVPLGDRERIALALETLGYGQVTFPLPVLRKLGKERVRKDVLLSLGFGLGVQVLMQLGRGVLAMILGFGWEAALGFITTDSLSVIFTLFITWIVRQADGLFEDQKHYLLRLQSEHQNEGREQF